MASQTQQTQTAYAAYRYAADGHAGEQGDGRIISRGSLDECRDAIARALGTTSIAGLRWDGLADDGDVEAYHESDDEGCGGYAICPVAYVD